MTNITTPSSIALMPGLEAAWQDVDISFDRFCLVAGMGAMEQVLREDAQRLPERASEARASADEYSGDRGGWGGRASFAYPSMTRAFDRAVGTW